jgi:hypothetical protein
MRYAPQPGTVAFRAIAHLETLPRGAELMTSALAEAIGCEGRNIAPSMEAALAAGLIYRRQRDNHVRSPMWWSLVDYSALPKVDIRNPAVPVADGYAEMRIPTFKDTPPKGSNRDAGAGQSHGAAGSASPNGRGTNGVPACGADPVFLQRGPRASVATNGVSDDDEGDSGRARRLSGRGDKDAVERSWRGSDSARGDRDPERRQGVLRAQSPGVAHQGTADASLISEAPVSNHGFRLALWSNGVLQTERSTVGGAAELVLLSRDETRALVQYLGCLDVVSLGGGA